MKQILLVIALVRVDALAHAWSGQASTRQHAFRTGGNGGSSFSMGGLGRNGGLKPSLFAAPWDQHRPSASSSTMRRAATERFGDEDATVMLKESDSNNDHDDDDLTTASTATTTNDEDNANTKQRIDIVKSIDLPFSCEVAYDAFSDLTRQPSWSPWLHKVEFLQDKPDHTKWTMNFLGFKYSWISISEHAERPHLITWESISGLKNYGTVTFDSTQQTTTTMNMKMTFIAPRAVSILFRKSKRIANIVENKMIQTTMENFRDVVINYDLKGKKKLE